ncbi:MAG: hypothetical protein QOH31_6015 [Verrucomicrobiota bacterium]
MLVDFTAEALLTLEFLAIFIATAVSLVTVAIGSLYSFMPTTTAEIISLEYKEATDRFHAVIEVTIPEGDDYTELTLEKIGNSIFGIPLNNVRPGAHRTSIEGNGQPLVKVGDKIPARLFTADQLR